MAYVRAVCEFRRLVLGDFDGALTETVRALTESYSCRSVRPVNGPNDDEHGSAAIFLELRQPRDRLVSLQCDHSSGHLDREIHRRLVRRKLVERLRLSEVTLTTDIRSIE